MTNIGIRMNNRRRLYLSKELELKLRSFFKIKGKTLIIGLGNIYRNDDGAGMAAILHLKKEIATKINNIELIEAERRLIKFVNLIEEINPSKILFIDAFDFGLKPGTVKILYEEQIQEYDLSTHTNNLNLFTAYLRKKIPHCKFLFIGIQLGSLNMTDEIILTDEVKKGTEKIVKIIVKILKKQLN